MKKRHSPPRVKKGICSYHLCRKRTIVYRCKYCGRYFCKDHIEPVPVLSFYQVTTAEEPIRGELEKIWRSDKGHPCYPYTQIFWDNLEKAERERQEKEKEALDKLLKAPSPSKVLTIPTQKLLPKEFNEQQNKPKKYRVEISKVLIIFFILLFFVFLGFNINNIKNLIGVLSLSIKNITNNISISIENLTKNQLNWVTQYETGPKENAFEYVLRGSPGIINFTVYKGVNDYFAGLPRVYYYYGVPPSDRDLELRFIDDEKQKKYIQQLVEIIKSKTNNSDDQVRIAVSLVQKIPYDWEGFYSGNLKNRYPYQVLYDKKGVCGEKSRLLAVILKELGYGVALFKFEAENHMAVGIKCPIQYSYYNSGYCFIETARPAIITDSQEQYIGVGKLHSTPEIMEISDGKSFNSVAEEYLDAQEWIKINNLSELNNGFLNPYYYREWQILVEKYGIEVGVYNSTLQ